jgi:hypothetical protein
MRFLVLLLVLVGCTKDDWAVVPMKQSTMVVANNPKAIVAVFPQDTDLSVCEAFKVAAESLLGRPSVFRCEMTERLIVVDTIQM